MPLYFLVGTLTEAGQKTLRENSDLIGQAVRECSSPDAKVLGQYAVLGRCDFVMIAECDDNQAVARLSLDLGVRVGLHIETLPAISIGVLSEDDTEDTDRGEASAEAGARPAQSESGPTEEWRLPPTTT